MILSRRRFLTGSAGLIVASVLSQAFPVVLPLPALPWLRQPIPLPDLCRCQCY